MTHPLKPYIDKRGYLTKSNGDGGDSIHRSGAAYTLREILGHKWVCWPLLPFMYEHFETRELRRHWGNPAWTAEYNRLSRDALIPYLTFHVVYEMRPYHFHAHLKRLLLWTPFYRRNGATKENHGARQWSTAKPLKLWEKLVLKWRIPFIEINKDYNNYNLKFPDLTLFEIWALYIRAMWRKDSLLKSAVLTLLDLETLVGIYIKNKKSDSDVLNSLLILSAGMKVNPTVTMRKAANIMDAEHFKRMIDKYFDDRPDDVQPLRRWFKQAVDAVKLGKF